MSTAPADIVRLVEQFEEHRDTYRRGEYNETQLRRDFLDPFFAALGWDVHNVQGYAEAYRDVIHEDSLRVEKSIRAPDYCFRIGGVRKFFVEAKRPSVDIRQDAMPAFQIRRYAWTAKLPLSILTDFEELAVYDCRVKPDKNDKASTARVLIFGYGEYVDRWDEIAGVFSREAILKGAFDKFVESTKKKRGTAEVDEAFLAEIEAWREALAKNLSLRNTDLSDRDLNFAVQRIIDRTIFLRMCEGRSIEEFGRLQALANGPQIYPRLTQLFRRADEKYNSGLFHFEREKGREAPDELTPGLVVDDKVLKDIITRLYYPESPYEFAALPSDILGQVYEQFLGKVIRLTAGHRAKIDEKPEVRKAGGVYYTPTYVVDYIVQNTVGRLVEGRTPQQVGGLTKTFKPSKTARPLTVLDPACGSGSFLIVAYQFLLDWYLRQYTEHDDPQQHARGANPRVYQYRNGDWRLTAAERKRILLGHIYGVDIDYQAVEVTKLSLLLKVLEGETEETLDRQRRLFHGDRALPDLANNIKCGNSLIGPDFYQKRQMSLFSEEERLRINVFDWDAEFRDIMRAGGFDAVIGNPPYVRMEEFKSIKDYLRDKYDCHDERSDLYAYFIEREHQLLNRRGRFGKIVSNKFILANYGRPLRRLLNTAAQIDRVVDLAGLPVFRGATVRTVVLLTGKPNGKRGAVYSQPPELDEFLAVEAGTKSLADIVEPAAYRVPAKSLREDGWRLLRPDRAKLLEKLQKFGEPLKAVVDGKICMGIKSGLTEAFVIDGTTRRKIVRGNRKSAEIIHPFLQGRHIRRYALQPEDQFLIYTPHGIDMSPYPSVLEHLQPFRKRLERRATKQAWYELQQPQFAYVEYLKQPKIVFPDIATGCRFMLDREGHFGANTVYFLPTDDLALLAILNSRLALFIFKQICAALEGPGEAYLRFFGQYMEGFPVPLPVRQTQSDQMVDLVQQMLDLHERVAQIKTAHDKRAVERQIDATDRQIDQLVYKLYGLKKEEIRIVEQATE